MRIAVMGAGATGGYLGALLARSGVDVTLIARGAHLRAMRERGLRVCLPDGEFTIPVQAAEHPAALTAMDVVIFAVKAYDTDDAAAAIAPLVGPSTRILCIQNGIDGPEVLARHYGSSTVLAGATRIEATVTEPGVIARLSPAARLEFGAWQGAASATEHTLLQLFQAAGVDTVLSADARRVIWEKFIFLGPLAGVTGATRMPIGPVRECAESLTLLRSAVEEAVAVGRSAGVQLANDAAQAVMRTIASLPPAMRTSFQRDLEGNRRVELDALTGAVVRLGGALGSATPVHTALYAVLRPAALAAAAAYHAKATSPA